MKDIFVMQAIMFGVITIFGLSVALSIEFWLEFVKQLKKRPYMFYSWSLLYVVLGIWGICIHDIYEFSLAGLVTLLYWLMLIKGALFGIFPKWFVSKIPDHPPKKLMVRLGFIYYIVGILLLLNFFATQGGV